MNCEVVLLAVQHEELNAQPVLILSLKQVQNAKGLLNCKEGLSLQPGFEVTCLNISSRVILMTLERTDGCSALWKMLVLFIGPTLYSRTVPPSSPQCCRCRWSRKCSKSAVLNIYCHGFSLNNDFLINGSL